MKNKKALVLSSTVLLALLSLSCVAKAPVPPKHITVGEINPGLGGWRSKPATSPEISQLKSQINRLNSEIAFLEKNPFKSPQARSDIKRKKSEVRRLEKKLNKLEREQQK